MVMCKIDGNYINKEQIKNRKDSEMKRAYQELLKRIRASGVVQPEKHILDNEASKSFKELIRTT